MLLYINGSHVFSMENGVSKLVRFATAKDYNDEAKGKDLDQ